MDQTELESAYKLLVFAGNIGGLMTYGKLDMLSRIAKNFVNNYGYDPSPLIGSFYVCENGSELSNETIKILTLLNKITLQEKEIIIKWVLNIFDEDEHLDKNEMLLMEFIQGYWEGVDVISLVERHYNLTENS